MTRSSTGMFQDDATLPSRERLHHPGPEQFPRFTAVPVGAHRTLIRLRQGRSILAAISDEMNRLGVESGMFILDGLRLADCHFVIPAGPREERHAAWYSETYQARSPVFQHAVAVVGWKDGERFVHCHAVWPNAPERGTDAGMGHVLNHETLVADDHEVEGYVVSGAKFDVAIDPETNFPLFHIVPHQIGAEQRVDAALVTIRPHEDMRSTLERAAAQVGLTSARIMGLGSLIGARFSDGTSMQAALSEILILDGARIRDGRCVCLPIVCVDPARSVFHGDLLEAGGPICVTCEVLFIRDDGNSRT